MSHIRHGASSTHETVHIPLEDAGEPDPTGVAVRGRPVGASNLVEDFGSCRDG